MPLYKEQQLTTATKILIWKIEEDFDDLFDEVHLTDRNIVRLMSMKSQLHQRAFLSVRKLLGHAGYSDFDMYYTESGKPCLKNGTHISISHSHDFSALILSDVPVGLDLEMMREKILKIADKFTSDLEERYLNKDSDDYIAKLTVLWGVKESIFKIRDEVGISFKDHITTFDFDLNSGEALARLDYQKIHRDFEIKFQRVENYMLVYAYEIPNE